MTFPPQLFEAAVLSVRGKPAIAGHDCSPSLQSILKSFEGEGKGDRVMLLALLQAKKAEDEVRLLSFVTLSADASFQQRLAALSYALAVQYLSIAAANQEASAQMPPPPPVVAARGLFLAYSLSHNNVLTNDWTESISSASSATSSSRRSGRSSFSDAESVATTVSVKSRKRKASTPIDNEAPSHSSVMSALRDKILARSPDAETSAPLPPVTNCASTPKRRKTATSPRPSAEASAPLPTLPTLPPRQEVTSRSTYHLPLSTALPIKEKAPSSGPSESEKFRASLNLLNIAAERESMRSQWQTSDVRGQAV